jgi:hypothetical protein
VLEDELFALFQAAGYCCRLCLLKVCAETLPSPFLQCTQGTPPSLLCVLFHFLFIIHFFFLWGRGQTVQGAMLVYPRGGCGDTMCRLFAHLLVCISQAGLELAREPSWFLSVMW